MAMRSDFAFELLPQRLPIKWIALVAILLVASIGYSSVLLWRSYSALRSARSEVEQLRSQLQRAQTPAAAPSAPLYAADAREALHLLQWPFDEGLREMERCLPPSDRANTVQLDGLTRELVVTAELSSGRAAPAFHELVQCLNGGRDQAVWSITQINEVPFTAGAAFQATQPNMNAAKQEGPKMIVTLRRKEAR